MILGYSNWYNFSTYLYQIINLGGLLKNNSINEIAKMFDSINFLGTLKVTPWTLNEVLEGREVKVTKLCPILCDPMDHTGYGILQTRVLEWVAFPFFRASSQPRDWTQVSHITGGFFTSWATKRSPRILEG